MPDTQPSALAVVAAVAVAAAATVAVSALVSDDGCCAPAAAADDVTLLLWPMPAPPLLLLSSPGPGSLPPLPPRVATRLGSLTCRRLQSPAGQASLVLPVSKLY